MEILQFKKANCKNCFKCLRECPVKAIAFKDGQAEILRDDCLLCGHCLTVCPQNAKEARDDTETVRTLLRSGRRVVASVAPSFIAAFGVPDLAAFEAGLRRLGFAAAQETARGAKLVAAEYVRLLRRGGHAPIISSCCPAVVRLMERYYQSLTPCLAPVLSPMQAHVRLLRREYPGAAVVFIGPCLCKKAEAEQAGIDCALTFEELEEWFAQAGVRLGPLPASAADAPAAEAVSPAAARLFPLRGGIIRAMGERLPGVRYVSVDGLSACRRVLDELAKGGISDTFLEMSACEGSCVGGPCMTHPAGGTLFACGEVEDFAGRAGGTPEPAPEEPDFSMEKRFRARCLERAVPGERELRAILAQTGKTSPDKELNCGACGYATCREKAVAVFQGRAEVTMCMPYMRERAEYISNEIIAFTPNAIVALSAELEIQALNTAACSMFRVEDASRLRGKYIAELLDPEIFEEAVIKGRNILNRKGYLFRYELTVEQSVVFVPEHNFVFGIFRDLTEEEHRKEELGKVQAETMQTADKVIEKQMRVVQEIAMLLGETAAETKVALTRLKGAVLPGQEKAAEIPAGEDAASGPQEDGPGPAKLRLSDLHLPPRAGRP